MRGKPVAANVDEYLAMVEGDEARASLVHLRAIIQTEIPEAKEAISYGMPMFMHHGMVVGFAAFKRHCSLFPGHTVADFESELGAYKISKGTIQFSPTSPLPDDLVRRIVRARCDENEQVAKEKEAKKKK